MADEIRFKVNPHWKKEEDIAERVAKVIGYTDCCPPFKKDSGYRWQLNANNDWWMDIDHETGEYILAYRYEAPLEAFKIVLEWIFQ